MSIHILGWLLSLWGAATSLPQIYRLYTTRDVLGVSIAMYLVWFVTWVGWFAVAYSSGSLPAMFSAAAGLVTSLAVASHLLL